MTGNLRKDGKSEMVDTITKQPQHINLSFSQTESHKNDLQGNHTDQVAVHYCKMRKKWKQKYKVNSGSLQYRCY